jgi:hypothetical protein
MRRPGRFVAACGGEKGPQGTHQCFMVLLGVLHGVRGGWRRRLPIVIYHRGDTAWLVVGGVWSDAELLWVVGRSSRGSLALAARWAREFLSSPMKCAT